MGSRRLCLLGACALVSGTFTVAESGRLVELPPTMIFIGPVSTTHLPFVGSAGSVWK